VQANQIQDVGPAAAAVLARLLTLLRSPSAPILPDDVRLFRVDSQPALAMVRPVLPSSLHPGRSHAGIDAGAAVRRDTACVL